MAIPLLDVESREVIKKIITARNISVRALSSMIGIAEQSVSSMLSGGRTLTDKTLVKMSEVLQIPFGLVKYGTGLDEYIQNLSIDELHSRSKPTQEAVSADYLDLSVNQAASRIQHLMDEDGLNQVELSEKINRSKGLVSGYLNPENKPSDIFLRTLEDRLGWSARWIRTGQGPARVAKLASRQEILDSYNHGSNGIALDDTNARSLGVHDPDVYQDVKFISYNVWASFTDNFGDFDFQDVKATYPVYLPRLNFPITDRHMVFEILGDSMEERLYNRDVVLTELVDDGNFDYLNSHIYVVAYRNQLVVKRVIDNDLLVNGTLTLHSDNKKHGKITIRREDIRYIWKFVAIVYSTAV